MTRLNVLLLGFASMLLTAFLNSWTDDAYTQDPADCRLQAGACDPDIADALASFP